MARQHKVSLLSVKAALKVRGADKLKEKRGGKKKVSVYESCVLRQRKKMIASRDVRSL